MLNQTADLLYPIFQDALEMLTLTHAAFINHDPAGLREICHLRSCC